MSWSYNDADSGLTLFSAALKAGAPMSFRPGMRVLEVGCCEADWIGRAHDAWPGIELVGIDTRAEDKESHDGSIQILRRDVRQADLFAPASFDAVVSISALEHVGLGHYKDPVDADGDMKATANIWRWLKPGGFLYFDVPYDPTHYWLQGTKCRIYDDAAIENRLKAGYDCANHFYPWLDAWRAYVDSETPGTFAEKPTQAAKRYWYVAMVWQKR